MLLYEHPVSLQYSSQEMEKRGKEEAVDHENLAERFLTLPFSVLVGNMDFGIDVTPTEVQKPRLGTPSFLQKKAQSQI